MTSQKIDNEMIYDLLKQQNEDLRDFKRDVSQRFDQIDKRFDQVDQRFNQIDKRLDRLEDKTDHMDQRLRGVENKIDDIRVTWSTRLVGTILGTSAVTSAIVAYFITSIS